MRVEAGVRYVPWGDSDEVSVEWAVFLTVATRAGWPGGLNEGHRTMPRQWYFYTHQPPLAAYPSATAPHIRTGHFDHAIDVNGSDWLIAFARRHGIVLYRSVRGEVWHLVCANPEALRAFARRHAASVSFLKFPTLRRGANGAAVRRLQRHLRAAHVKHGPQVTGHFGPNTQAALKRFQRSHGLRPDGVCGPATWRKLRRVARRQRQKG